MQDRPGMTEKDISYFEITAFPDFFARERKNVFSQVTDVLQQSCINLLFLEEKKKKKQG